MAEENEKPAEPQEGQSQPGSGSDAPSESAPPWAAEPVVVVDPADEFEEDGSALPFLVCGIGASAGGVEAYIELFGSLAPDTGIAYVLVPHLMPDQKSHLVEILSRHTPMQVAEIVPGTVPKPDHVYILPPGVRATLKRGAFELRSRITDGAPRSIDEFFPLAGRRPEGPVGGNRTFRHRCRWRPGAQGDQGRGRYHHGTEP